MPKLKMVLVQTQKELLVKCEDLSAELHELMRFQEGNYVEDVGPRMYGEYVRTLSGLARAALDAQRFYMMKMFLLEQEREIRDTLTRRERGGAKPESNHDAAPSAAVQGKARVRL